MTVIVKNTTGSDVVWCGQGISANSSYTLFVDEISRWAANSDFLAKVYSREAVINNGSNDVVDPATAVDTIKGDLPIFVQPLPPFAEPSYRTKRNKTASLTVVTPGASSVVDFVLAQERYVSGGCIIIQNAQMGDYVIAEVYDLYSGIPVAYRAAMCENWPVIVRYVEGEWIAANPSITGGVTVHEISTHPLNAKITAGLSLRLTYHAVNTGVDRAFGVNYYLTSKIA